jgi:predicted transcriptional regulator of viral defense system
MRKKGANREQVIARLAANQHGVVAAAQLRDAGIPDYSVTRRAQAGRLHRLHRGVYAVGHTKLTFDGRCIAAALAVGEVAVVSHRSAAAIWAMISDADLEGDADLTRSELERIFLNLCRRHRDAQLQRLGFRVLRFTYRQLTRERSAVVAALHALLSQRSLTPNL